MLRNLWDTLFDNIGQKIMHLVKMCFFIEAIVLVAACAVSMVISLFNGRFLAFLLLPLGTLLVLAILWVGSWLTYAFGELVQRAGSIDENLLAAKKALLSGNQAAQRLADATSEEHSRQRTADLARQERARRALREAEGRSGHEAAEMIRNGQEERIRNAAAQYAQENTAQAGGAEPENIPENEQLAARLNVALSFQTDDGMIRYLKKMDHELVQKILKEPPHRIRKLIENIVEDI